MKKAFTLIELLIVVAIIAILAAIAVPNFLEAQTRSKVSRAKSDMRTLATGIESFMVDRNTYPAYQRQGITGAVADKSCYNMMAAMCNQNDTAARDVLNRHDSFRVPGTGSNFIQTLTTPVSYMTSYPTDPFKDSKGVTFYYYTNGGAWITWSCGPDTDQSIGGQLTNSKTGTSGNNRPPAETLLDLNNVTRILAGPIPASTSEASYTYDATNGTSSKGDVWRSSNSNN
ncbi:prepilin-type N-terminal cleavage/methylation domain-containing protein [Candidatus Sumerlaeota bacterium]|nr:prepilin-type N-terminal cleavage/methylation domain-containing protein [Candidatus Sumerlaeales bacterium]NLD61847.1 prepilin-type N-terminal cleavage/methylation domain-containing protein [Candidatus Sumerlaeota bacterium]